MDAADQRDQVDARTASPGSSRQVGPTPLVEAGFFSVRRESKHSEPSRALMARQAATETPGPSPFVRPAPAKRQLPSSEDPVRELVRALQACSLPRDLEACSLTRDLEADDDTSRSESSIAGQISQAVAVFLEKLDEAWKPDQQVAGDPRQDAQARRREALSTVGQRVAFLAEVLYPLYLRQPLLEAVFTQAARTSIPGTEDDCLEGTGSAIKGPLGRVAPGPDGKAAGQAMSPSDQLARLSLEVPAVGAALAVPRFVYGGDYRQFPTDRQIADHAKKAPLAVLREAAAEMMRHEGFRTITPDWGGFRTGIAPLLAGASDHPHPHALASVLAGVFDAAPLEHLWSCDEPSGAYSPYAMALQMASQLMAKATPSAQMAAGAVTGWGLSVIRDRLDQVASQYVRDDELHPVAPARLRHGVEEATAQAHGICEGSPDFRAGFQALASQGSAPVSRQDVDGRIVDLVITAVAHRPDPLEAAGEMMKVLVDGMEPADFVSLLEGALWDSPASSSSRNEGLSSETTLPSMSSGSPSLAGLDEPTTRHAQAEVGARVAPILAFFDAYRQSLGLNPGSAGPGAALSRADWHRHHAILEAALAFFGPAGKAASALSGFGAFEGPGPGPDHGLVVERLLQLREALAACKPQG